MAVYSVKLNGKKKFKDFGGDWVRWDGRWIESLSTYDNSGSALDATYKLTGRNWKIETMLIDSDNGGTARIVDLNGKQDRRIEFLRLDVNSDVQLTSTRIKHIDGSGDVDQHRIVLGDANVDTIALFGVSNIVETGSNFVDLINIGGKGKVTVSEGGAGLIRTNDEADLLTVKNGYVQKARLRDGADEITVTSGGGIGALHTGDGTDSIALDDGDVGHIETGNGRDVLTASNGSSIRAAYLEDGNDEITLDGSNADAVWLGSGNNTANLRGGAHVFFMFGEGGDNTVTLSGNSRLNSLELGNGTHVVDVQDTSQIQHMKFYDSTVTVTTADDWFAGIDAGGNTTVDVTIGGGGAGQLKLGDGNDSVTTNGWVETISTGSGGDTVNVGGGADTVSTDDGDDTVTVTGSVNRVSLGHGDDTVTTGDDHVAVLEAWSGSNSFIIGAGGATIIRGGENSDTVTTTTGWIETISTGRGADTVNLGSAAANSVRLGDGDDTLVLSESPDRGGRYDGGEGVDTLDYSLWTVGITFSLDANGWQNPGAPDGVVTDAANDRGYIIESRFENVIGTDQADAITGDEGDNTFTGNSGADVFTFTATMWDPALDAGTDTVTDFEDGTDLLRLPGQSFGTLTLADQGPDLKIIHADGEIILKGLAGVTLSAADFLFV